MVNTGDIFQAEEAEKAEQTEKAKVLDNELLAMDVVDTLRHEEKLIDSELSGEARHQALMARARVIYDAQGIEISDEVLMNGILALEEDRFEFEPPKGRFGLKLAKIYIHRKRWLPIFTLFSFIIGVGWTINYYSFERPAKLKAERIEKMFTETLPNQLTKEREKGLALAQTEAIKDRVKDLYSLGDQAVSARDLRNAEKYSRELRTLTGDLTMSYQIRIVSRPGEFSGVFRTNDDNTKVRNYYLIVEALNAAGEIESVKITSEEDQKTRRTDIWGVRVTEAVFNQVAADKKDDAIIQNNIIGSKRRGYLEPEYTIDASGGYILEW